jgi:hypothetical protein
METVMNSMLKEMLSRPIRQCELTVEKGRERWIGKDEDGKDVYAYKIKECAVRLRRRCALTGKRIEKMEECPTDAYYLTKEE